MKRTQNDRTNRSNVELPKCLITTTPNHDYSWDRSRNYGEPCNPIQPEGMNQDP